MCRDLNYTDGTKQRLGTWQTAFGSAVDKRITHTLKIPDGKVLQGITHAKIQIHTIKGDTLVVSRPKLEIGNKATDWTPAPEDLEAAISTVSASLESFKTTQASKDTAQTSEINTAKSQIAGHTSEISTLKTTKADSSQVVTLARTGLQSEWRSYTDTAKRDAATDAQTKATAAKDAAIAEARELDTTTNAKVTALQKTVADNQSAMATRVSTVEATASGNTARITSTSDAVSALDGKVQALYSIKVESISNNRKVVAGLALGADGATGDSQLLIYADKFGLVNPQSKAFDVPFAVNQSAGGAKMALKGDFIADGTIHGKHIAASQTIQSPVINGAVINAGTLNSTAINNGNGNFTVDSAGNMVAKSGRFEGTVYADKIEGDVVDFFFVGFSGFRDIRPAANRAAYHGTFTFNLHCSRRRYLSFGEIWASISNPTRHSNGTVVIAGFAVRLRVDGRIIKPVGNNIPIGGHGSGALTHAANIFGIILLPSTTINAGHHTVVIDVYIYKENGVDGEFIPHLNNELEVLTAQLA